MKNTTTPDYHFSPTFQDWTACDAKISCRLDHMTQSEYTAHMSTRQEEVTLLDSKLGEAEIAYIGAKTDLTVEQIQETLRELRREGSQLPAPTAAEIKSFIEQERFKVENDPTLSKKEKRNILRSLREAEKELEKNQREITGGVFHAWKNGLLAALARVRKPLMVGALAGGLAFGLAACSPAANNDTTAPPAKNPADTVQVEECETDIAVGGDIILGDVKSNSSGEYCSVVINPDSPALVYDNTKVDPALYELGYTDEQLESIQKQAVETAVVNMLDNPSVGQDPAELTEWIKTEGPKYYKQEIVDAYLSENPSDAGYRGSDVTFSSSAITPKLKYDGGPRIVESNINVVSISLRSQRFDEDEVTNDIEVIMDTTTKYRLDEETYPEWTRSYFAPYIANGNVSESAIDSLLSGIDNSKPVYVEGLKNLRIGYSEADVKSGEGKILIRSSLSTIPDFSWASPGN